MSINITSRKHRVLIGGEDWSNCVLEISNWSTAPLSSSGLITTTATIILIPTFGVNPRSLDDRTNPLWRVGNTVTIDITDSSGVLQRHPVGALRILSAEYNPEVRSLTLNCGCLITLLNYRQPTTPDAASITPGRSSDRALVVASLLQAAGITNYNLRYHLPYPLNYPIQINGSYLEAVGKLLYSAGFVGWIDNSEVFQIKPVRLEGNASATLQIGGDAGDELWYRRLSSPEAPREIIRVSGVATVATPPDYPLNTYTTKYGDARTVDPALSGTCVLSHETVEETWDVSTKIKQITTLTQTPIGVVIPYLDYSSPAAKLALIERLRVVERYSYENNTSGRLLRVNKQISKTYGEVFAEFVTAREDIRFTGLQNLFLAESIEVSYTYNPKGIPTITTARLETEGAILAGTDPDWDEYSTFPSNFKVSETSVETWEERHKREWVHTLDALKVIGRVKPEAIGDDAQNSDRLVLVADNNAAIKEVSNSGQTVPPAPERHPPLAEFEEVQIFGEARFSQVGGNPFRARSRSFQIDYLEGNPKVAKLQCDRAAQIEGALLYGRFKGQDLGCDLKDVFYNWQPLMRVNCIEPDGTVRAFCLDDAHWFLGQEKALCSMGCIWIGDVGAVRSSQFAIRNLAQAGDTVIEIEAAPTYIEAHTVLNIGGVEVITTAPTQPGDTAITVMPLTQPIPLYELRITNYELRIPYVRVQNLVASGLGSSSVVKRPYSLASSRDVSVAASGVGAATVSTSTPTTTPTSFYWDVTTTNEWNNLSTEAWDNCLSGSAYNWNTVTQSDWDVMTEQNWSAIA